MISTNNRGCVPANSPRNKFLSLWRRVVVLGLTLTTLTGYAAAQSEKPLTYVDILHQLTDLDRLTRLQTGCKGGLFSSWDRNSKTYWGANGDAGQYLRVEPNGEAVMMDIDGPGVIYRTWSANPMGKIRIYLDGAATPSYEWNFPDLFDGKLPPFIKPLVYRRDGPQSASDCYLPIPFAKHIKITADKAARRVLPLQLRPLPQGPAGAQFPAALERRRAGRPLGRRGRVVAPRPRSEAATARPGDRSRRPSPSRPARRRRSARCGPRG